MKNFMSLIYIKTNAVSEEKICVGLFIGDSEQNLFAWSDNKIKICNKLINDNISSSINKTFSNISKDIVTTNPKCKSLNISFKNNKYSYEYFDYLNKYNNGILEFTEPKILHRHITESDFIKLYKLYIGEDIEHNEKKSESFYKKFKKQIDNPLFHSKTDINYKIPENIISSIYRPQSIDFISCNGNILAGQSVDFSATPHTIENNLYSFRAIVQGLSDFAIRRKFEGMGKYILYFDNPTNSEQTNIFNNAYKDNTKPFIMKHIDDIEEVENVLEEHEYKKFSEVISSNA